MFKLGEEGARRGEVPKSFLHSFICIVNTVRNNHAAIAISSHAAATISNQAANAIRSHAANAMSGNAAEAFIGNAANATISKVANYVTAPTNHLCKSRFELAQAQLGNIGLHGKPI